MKKPYFYMLLLIIAILISIMCFCKKHNIVSKNQEIETVVLNYWTFDEMYKKFMEKYVDQWNKLNKIQINLKTSVYSADELDYKLWSSLQLGINAPDIVDLEHSKFARYMEPKFNHLIPLNSIIDSKKKLITDLSYIKYQRKGFYYAVDYYENNAVIFYNREIFSQLDVSPSNIKTFDEYIDIGKRLKEETGQYILAMDFTDDLLYEILLNKENTGYLDSMGAFQLNSTKNVEILEKLHNMIYLDKIATHSPTGDYFSYEFYNLLNSGEIASIIAPYWYKGYIKEYMPALYNKLMVAVIPSMFNDSKLTARTSGIATAITNQCEAPILAKQLLSYIRLQSETGANIFYDLSGDPIIHEAWDVLLDKAVTMQLPTHEVEEIKLLTTISADYYTDQYSENYNEAVTEVINTILFQVLRENTKEPKDALDEAQEKLFKRGTTLDK